MFCRQIKYVHFEKFEVWLFNADVILTLLVKTLHPAACLSHSILTQYILIL